MGVRNEIYEIMRPMSTKSDLELSVRNLNRLYSIILVQAENGISLIAVTEILQCHHLS